MATTLAQKRPMIGGFAILHRDEKQHNKGGSVLYKLHLGILKHE